MSRDGSYKDIKILIKVGLVMHFISPLIFLRGTYDLDAYCKTAQVEVQKPQMEIQDLISALEYFLANYVFVKQPLPDCTEYDHHQTWLYNYIFAVVFILGCNFTHFDKYPFNQITLEWEIMKNWSSFIWYCFGAIMGFILINIVYLFFLYYMSGCLWEYVIFTVGVVGFIVIKTS